MSNVTYLPVAEAMAAIRKNVERLLMSRDVDVGFLQLPSLDMYIERFVYDTLDYCHRTDFPRTLTYVAAELAVKYLVDSKKSDDGNGPLKSLRENDVTFEWAVDSVSPIGCISEEDFNKLRPKLNLYRKVVWGRG